MNSMPRLDGLAADAVSTLAPLDSDHRDSIVLAELSAARRRVETVLVHEIEAMVVFALNAGFDLPPAALAARYVAPPDPGRAIAATGETPELVVRLADLHLTLTRLVTPARGATLVLLAEQRRVHPQVTAFGPVPLVRWMMAVAVLSLAFLLGTALSPDVSRKNIALGLLDLNGTELVIVETFLIAAAGVGASLANLKRLNRYISDCNYDPRYDSSYWTRLVMGMISGIILSQMVFGATGTNPPETPAGSALISFGQPLLAILGGFSADLVHDVLTHFIGVVGEALGLKYRATPSRLTPPA